MMTDNSEIKVDIAVINGYSNKILQLNSELNGLKFSDSAERTTLTASSNAGHVTMQAENCNMNCENTVDSFIAQVKTMSENYMDFDEKIGNTYK